jgi:hypothetical protein
MGSRRALRLRNVTGMWLGRAIPLTFTCATTVFRRPVPKLHLRNASGSRDLFPSSPSDRYGDSGTHLSDDGLALHEHDRHSPDVQWNCRFQTHLFIRNHCRFDLAWTLTPRTRYSESETMFAATQPRNNWMINLQPKGKRNTERSRLINKQSLQGPLIDPTANVRRFLCPFATCPVVYCTILLLASRCLLNRIC